MVPTHVPYSVQLSASSHLVGINLIVTLGKQLLNMTGSLIQSG